jgi:type IV pilus assembly protein PilE
VQKCTVPDALKRGRLKAAAVAADGRDHESAMQQPAAASLSCIAPAALRRRGFTLIELMIALAVVAVLAAVAIPSYLSQIRSGRRADAVAAANAVLQAQERWRGEHTTYSANLSNLVAASYGVATTSPDGYYTIATSTVSGSAGYRYVVTATAVSSRSQAADSGCTVLTLTADQRSTPSLSYTPAGCWKR